MGRRLRLLSPAKINILLRVLRKRKDGYHDIETLFERIGLCDSVVLEPLSSGIRLEVSGFPSPKGMRNLAYRAARLLKDRYRVSAGVGIMIHKRIPVAAGIGLSPNQCRKQGCGPENCDVGDSQSHFHLSAGV